jgi:glycosyltransferase involved in cell wall biosynthesis
MSITHINSYFIASPLHSELVTAMDKAEVEQHVFVPVETTSHMNKNIPTNLQHGEIHYTHCFNTLHRYLWPLKMLRIWQAFKKHVTKHPAKLIHAHTLIVNGLIAYWAHKKWGTPYFVTVRNADLNVFLKNLPFLKPLALKVLDHAARIITISPAYRDQQLHQYFHKKKHPEIYLKCEVMPNGIHDFWIENRHVKENSQEVPTLIFSGRVDKNKNLKGLMDACELLTKGGFGLKLNILGDGPLLAIFKNRAHGFAVNFHGHVSDKIQMLHIMRESDLMVVPSFTESFGLVYPEAMSQGLPVIYTRGQGFDGHFPDGHVGFAVDPNSSNDIAEKIKMAFDDHERLSANAYEASLEFSWKNVATQLLALYDKV